MADVYTSGSEATLPTTDAALADHTYDATDITAVATDDGSRVSQSATDEYAIHQFNTDCGAGRTEALITWNGQSDIAPSSVPVYLQAYKHSTGTWVTIDFDDSTAANTDFDLTYTLNSGSTPTFAQCEDGNSYITCRVYQNYTAGAYEEFGYHPADPGSRCQQISGLMLPNQLTQVQYLPILYLMGRLNLLLFIVGMEHDGRSQRLIADIPIKSSPRRRSRKSAQ